ncbi:family 78 glycoside hydrolase catalytic domain [Cohnella hongkongensis]|uniref:alpha-L-rhamnosidase n=1 Tax=Cohnella hongkongensis TaxID=178337 RepID=A0ABV9F8Q6_9BACL
MDDHSPAAGGPDDGRTAVADLRLENRVNPLGIDRLRPRFSWKLHADRRNIRQSAYRIVVGIEGLFPETAVWDSGKIESDQSVFVPYEGPPLQSRVRYCWRVKVWDERGIESLWSECAWWEMGLLSPADWTAQWIEPEQVNASEEQLQPAPLLRREFTVRETVKKARIYATARGLYQLELNGSKVGDQELAPEFSSYENCLQYQTYDVTKLVRVGANALGAMLGDGWHAGRIGLTGDCCSYGDRLSLLLQLEIETVGGSVMTIPSDEQFRCSFGEIVYSDLFIGEMTDARLRQDGWSEPGFDDSNWAQAAPVPFGYDHLTAQYAEPVRAVAAIRPLRIVESPKGETIIDLGQNIAGRMRFRASGPAGTRIVLEHGEILDEQGNFRNNIIGKNKDQKDIFILRGDASEEFEPRFTYHGFRYVKITGYPGVLDPNDFTGIVIGSDLRPSGSFECSDSRINRLQANIVWSQRSNMVSIPTDCPQREKAGWLGDIQAFAPTSCFNMEMYAFLSGWLRNVRFEQLKDGRIPSVVPFTEGFKRFLKQPYGYSSAGWGDAIVILPWVLYRQYGDLQVLRDNYEAMKKWLEFIRSEAPEEVWEPAGLHFGDWLIPSLSMGDGEKAIDMRKSAYLTAELVSTCFYAHSARLLADIAELLGKADDALHYRRLNRRIRQAFAKRYVREDGLLTAHFQGIYVLALHMDMLPDRLRDKAVDHLVALIRGNGWKLDTGFVSVPYLLDVLCDNDRQPVAYRLLLQTECPSWLYAVEKGATTIWEAWQAILPDGRATNVSYNHYALGCVGDWLYRRLGGIDKLEPGYRHILIDPDTKSGFSFAKASYESVYGTICSAWERNGDMIRLSVEIPANTRATVVLPDGQRIVGSGRHEFHYNL